MALPHKKSLGGLTLAHAALEQLSVYVVSDPRAVIAGVDAERFFDKAYDTTLLEMLSHIVQLEGPILDSVLVRRVARAHGWQRTGSKIRDRVTYMATAHFRKTKERVGHFYWPQTLGESDVVFRRPQCVDSYRTADEICLTELSALVSVLAGVGCVEGDIVREMSSAIGLHRMSAASRSRFEQAISVSRLRLIEE